MTSGPTTAHTDATSAISDLLSNKTSFLSNFSTTSWPPSTSSSMLPHVIVLKSPLEFSPEADIFIGVILVLCLIFGTPANALSLIYFAFKQKSEGILLVLYVAISITDICICLFHLPVTALLFNGRKPTFFESIELCETWEYLYNILPYFSMFLVMLLTVTRTIAIIQPFRRIKRACICYIIAGYLVFTIINIVAKIFLETSWYIKEFAYCASTANEEEEIKWVVIQNVLVVFQVALPSILIFISFCMSVDQLMRRPNPKMGAWRVRHRVSVTISMFTALFLFWNIPFFTNIILLLITQAMNVEYPKPFFTSKFMGSYSWVIGKVLFVVLNATSNPILYMCRMKGFAKWIGLGDTQGPDQGGVKNNFKYLMPMTQALTLNPAIKNVRAASRRLISLKRPRNP